ncbi:uncharacterized protein ACNS7B_020321 isoform 2-T3 [Menidia menidia]
MTRQIPRLPFKSPTVKAALAQCGADDQRQHGKSETEKHGLESEYLAVAEKETLTSASVLLQDGLIPACASDRRTGITKCVYVSLCYSPFHLCKMHQTQNHWRKAKGLKRKRKFLSSVKGVTHLARRDKRRMYCKLQLWMWRKRREKCRFWIFSGGRRAPAADSGPRLCLRLKTQLPKAKKHGACDKPDRQNPPVSTPGLAMPLGHDAGCSEAALGGQNGPLKRNESDQVADVLAGPSRLQLSDTDPTGQITPSPAEHSESTQSSAHPSKPYCTVRPQQCADSKWRAQRLDSEAQSPEPRDHAGPHVQGQSTEGETDGTVGRETTTPCLISDFSALRREIQEFLDDFYRTYGSFIPLKKSDVLRHVRRRFNADFSDWKHLIYSEAARCRAEFMEKATPSFRVVYKKHILTMEDLLTLANQNWLNDQVMNMYGELIMESSQQKIHFLNSFFHRQLMTKGYDGVRRWTKQVNLFSKSLLLVPVHLEVHWCLVTADIATKKICLYDSQGNALQKVGRNILKYLMTEAREKQQRAFEEGWTVSFNENVPQQTNENDCGVFVLEYSRCLALSRPLQFSQNDIPKIRKRIYRELCECKLHEQD